MTVGTVEQGTLKGVSRVWLGTAALGRWGNGDRADCVRLIHRALDAGVNAIDTADSYSDGDAEMIVGEAAAHRRDALFIATKFGYGSEGVAAPITSSEVVRAAERSLRRLRTDRIDLYQIHRLHRTDDIDELLTGLGQLVVAGKVGAIGTSMFSPKALKLARHVAERLGIALPATEQAPYSLLVREIDSGVVDTCRQLGVAVIAFAPLNGGWLTGKYQGDVVPAGSRAADWPVRRVRFDFSRRELAEKAAAVTALTNIALDADMSLAHMALAFVLSNRSVSAMIVGPRTSAQLDELRPAFDLTLSRDTLERIDAVVAPGRTLDPEDVLAYRVP